MAGKADVCQGCPGRQLCLSQGNNQSLHAVKTVSTMLTVQNAHMHVCMHAHTHKHTSVHQNKYSLPDSAGQVDPDQKFIDVRMNAVKRKILILSGKGG